MDYSAGQELSSLAFDKIIGGALDAVVKAQSASSISTVNFVKQTGFKLNDKGEATEPIYVSFKYPKEIAQFQAAKAARFTLQIINGGSGYKEENISGCTINEKMVDVSLSISETGEIISASFNQQIDDVANDAQLVVTCSGENVKAAVIKCKKIAAQNAKPAVYQDMELKVPILTMLPIPFIRVATTDIEFNVKINSMENTESLDESKKSIGGEASVGYKGFGVTANVSFNASMASQKKTSSTAEIKKEFSLNIKVHAVQDDMPAGLSRILDILEESIVPNITAPKTAALQ